jgi:hypothetical protein
MKEDCIEIYKKYASDDLCDSLVSIIDKYLLIEGSRSEENSITRRDFQILLDWVDPGPCEYANKVRDALNNAVGEYREKYLTLLQETAYISYRIKLQKTPIGGGFHNWHCENGAGIYADRVLVWTMYLNSLPDGEGETEFLHYGKRIQPCKGDILIFPAYFMHTHRGNPPITTEKYIATGWWNHAK